MKMCAWHGDRWATSSDLVDVERDQHRATFIAKYYILERYIAGPPRRQLFLRSF